MNARMLIVGLIAVVLAGCMSTREQAARSLIPPANSTRESRQCDILECAKAAERAFYAGAPPLTPAEKAPLGGRSTQRFWVRTGSPLRPHGYRPVIDKDMVPCQWGGFDYGAPGDCSDRYVLCLMRRGYQWPMPVSK